MSINKVLLIGNAVRDPECRFLPSGETVSNLNLATSEKWKDKSGAMQEKAEYHNLVFFGKHADLVKQYVKKGAKLYIEGRLQTRKWTDKDGKDRYTTDIIVHDMEMLDRKQSEVTEHSKEKANGYAPEPKPLAGGFDDDVPF